MSLADDELYEAAALQQNFIARSNSQISGNVYDFYNRQGKNLIDGTDAQDATTLQQVKALIAAASANLQNQITMLTTQGTIPAGYVLQTPANVSDGAPGTKDDLVLNYSGAGIFTSFFINNVTIGTTGTASLKYSVDGQPFTSLQFSGGGSSDLSSACQPYSTVYTGGKYTLFFYTPFKQILQVYVSFNNYDGGGNWSVGYAKKLG